MTKRIPIDAEMTFFTRDGKFSVHESQYATQGGRLIARVADGTITRKREGGHYVWIYQDRTPGSTDVSGPAVNHHSATPALRRIRFGAVRNESAADEKCLEGRGSDPQTS
jgi:hypothetical protein